MSNVRELSLIYIQKTLASDHFEEGRLSDLSTKDRGLYTEFTNGIFREWFYLEWVLKQYSKTSTKLKLKTNLFLSAYSLLFLDQIPEYAVYSEMKTLAKEQLLSEPEVKFLTATLKKIAENKTALLEKRSSALSRLAEEQTFKDDFDFTVLNCTKDFLDEFGGGLTKKIPAFLRFKKPAKLIGFPIGEAAGKSQSDIAPLSLVLTAEELGKGFWVQGEASQAACYEAAKVIKPGMNVLEVSTGKGGKLLGTARHLKEWGFPKSEKVSWIANDPSRYQIQFLERSVAPILADHFPFIDLKTEFLDFTQFHEDVKFDFVWVDAPCSGFGTIGKHPHIPVKHALTAKEDVKTCTAHQKKILEHSISCMKDGGKLFYSVCTLTRSETKEIKEYLQKKLDRKPILEKEIWPGSKETPDAEGFYMVMF